MLWTISDVPSALLNCVMRARISADQVDFTIQAVIEQARRRGAPLLWLVGPASRPADLGAHLEEHGFIYEPSAGMAIDLAQLKKEWAEEEKAATGLHVGSPASGLPTRQL